MKLSYIMALMMTGAILAGCSNENAQKDAHTASAPAYTDTVLPEKCYKRLEGTIAGQPIVLHLQRAGSRFNAMYYYTSQGRWITLDYLKDSSNSNRFSFYEYTSGNPDLNSSDVKNARLSFTYSNGSITGQWISGDNAKNYDFTLKETYPEGAYRFTTIYLADSVIGFDSKPDGPKGNISEFFVLPEGNDAAALWLQTEIKKILYLDSAGKGMSIEEAIRKSNKAYLASYKNDIKAMENEEFMATLNYESMQEVSVRYNERGYVILESLSYDYSGGAHGNYGSALYCLDAASKRRLALQDVIAADSSQLRTLLEKNFRAQIRLAASRPLTEYLFENRLMPNDNFYFTNKGIGFLYNPYEIAAYALGQINVFIPYTELKQYIRPDFAKRMGL